jgi:DNA-binding response OmpR family regulator
VKAKQEPGMGAEPESHGKSKPAKILVVEDQFLLASHLAQILSDAGFTVIGPVLRVADGLRMINALDGPLDVAILDVDLAGERSDLIAEELSRRGIPFMFATTHDRQRIALQFADRPRISKPYGRNNVFRILSSIMRQN